MNAPRPQPSLGDYSEPPDGDYARYIERLTHGHNPRAGAAPPEAAARPRLPVPAKAATSTVGAKAVALHPATQAAATRAVLAKWPLLLWGLFALLMWFAPALLPFAIGGAMLVGVGLSVWRSRRRRAGSDR